MELLFVVGNILTYFLSFFIFICIYRNFNRSLLRPFNYVSESRMKENNIKKKSLTISPFRRFSFLRLQLAPVNSQITHQSYLTNQTTVLRTEKSKCS